MVHPTCKTTLMVNMVFVMVNERRLEGKTIKPGLNAWSCETHLNNWAITHGRQFHHPSIDIAIKVAEQSMGLYLLLSETNWSQVASLLFVVFQAMTLER